MKDAITQKWARETPVGPDGRPADPRKAADDRGDTLAEQQQNAVPRMPHERDESSDSQPRRAAGDQKLGEQAHADATGSQQDTDKSAVMDKTYREQLKGGENTQR